MDVDALTTAPAWFKPRSALQEDMVLDMQQSFRDTEAMEDGVFDSARERGLPMAAETVRDQDCRSSAFLRENIRPWTRPVWERLRRSRMKKKNPIKFWFSNISSFLSHA